METYNYVMFTHYSCIKFHDLFSWNTITGGCCLISTINVAWLGMSFFLRESPYTVTLEAFLDKFEVHVLRLVHRAPYRQGNMVR